DHLAPRVRLPQLSQLPLPRARSLRLEWRHQSGLIHPHPPFTGKSPRLRSGAPNERDDPAYDLSISRPSRDPDMVETPWELTPAPGDLLLAGAAGFEPAHGGTKNRCLTAWLRPNFRCERVYSGSPLIGKAALEAHDPPIGVRRLAALDSDQLVLEHRRHLPRSARTDGEARLAAGYLANRRHHRGRAAGEAFGKAAALGVGLPLVDCIALLAHSQPGILRQRDDRIARDTRQDCPGEWRRNKTAVLKDEEHVHAA